MIKRFIMFKAKAGLSPEAFRTYYETQHAPLGIETFPMMKVYKRNYIQEIIRRPEGAVHPGFDVITEIQYETLEDYQAMVEKSARPEVRAVIAPDEARFMEPNTRWAFIVDEASLPDSK